ncbi:MAG TPA: hypothetical protein VHL98_11135 [Microvirga sp.]|jgi:hypothetical protein|nr:hypothetical protein [Microvirga sp.]
MAAAEKREKDPVAEAARLAWQDSEGNVKVATAMLEEAVRRSRSLRDALTEPFIAQACYDAIRGQVRTERKTVWSPPPAKRVADAAAGAERVVQLASGTLLMFPLPGGKRLGEATREDITEAAEFYSRQAGDMAVKARWLQLIGQSVPPNRKVQEILTDERLRELQEAAREG